jgi:hypothetical protein
VRARLLSGASPQIDPSQFIDEAHTDDTVQALFEALVAGGVLRKRVQMRCRRCSHLLEQSDLDNALCPSCEFDFAKTGEDPLSETIFLIDGGQSREIPWLVAIHGFKTHGKWQQDFSWLLATRFKHRAPALMHKFSYLTYGVLFRWKHRLLARELDRRLRWAIYRAHESGIADPPDIVAHSFGSLLFASLLNRKESADLRFGRVILAGAIVRPDYDWSRHLQSGKIEAILNHCSRTDTVVNYAQWFIPDSGPSGRVGFQDRKVLNLREEHFDHGTHFEPETMIVNLEEGGSWDRFLRLPLASLEEGLSSYQPPEEWR